MENEFVYFMDYGHPHSVISQSGQAVREKNGFDRLGVTYTYIYI